MRIIENKKVNEMPEESGFCSLFLYALLMMLLIFVMSFTLKLSMFLSITPLSDRALSIFQRLHLQWMLQELPYFFYYKKDQALAPMVGFVS